MDKNEHNMTPTDPTTVMSSIGRLLFYAFISWRLFKDNRGNRVIQCIHVLFQDGLF